MPKSPSDFKASSSATRFDVFDVLKWYSSNLTGNYKFKPPTFFVARLGRSQGLLSLDNILELFTLAIIYPHLFFFVNLILQVPQEHCILHLGRTPSSLAQDKLRNHSGVAAHPSVPADTGYPKASVLFLMGPVRTLMLGHMATDPMCLTPPPGLQKIFFVWIQNKMCLPKCADFCQNRQCAIYMYMFHLIF